MHRSWSTSITSNFCTTSVQMPVTCHRRYCGTMYFPSLDKRESWSESMKDLKSRCVNDCTSRPPTSEDF